MAKIQSGDSLSGNLRRAMETAKLSATDLTKRSGVSLASLSRILTGQVNPSLGHMVKIAQALNVSLDSLAGSLTVLDGGKNAEREAPISLPAGHASETDVLVSFVLEDTDLTPREAARLLSNAATGSWVHSWTENLIDYAHTMKPRPTVAMPLGPRTVAVDVAFPHDLMEAGSVVSLISVISATVTSTGARIDDIRLPPILLRTYQGAAFGVQGVRDSTGKYGRPILSATMRPPVGLSPKMYGRAVHEALVGGLDMTADPTLLHSLPSNGWRERAKYLSEALFTAREESGEGKLHALNVSAPTVEQMIERADFAQLEQIGAVSVDSAAVGWSAMESLARWCAKHDMILCALGGRALHNGPLSQQLVAKLLRVVGCDVVSVGSPLRGSAQARRTVTGIVTSLREQDPEAFPEGHIMYDQPTCGLRTVLPACGGGHNVWHLPQLMDALGNDMIIQCGGSTMGHPGGSMAGATANRVAIEALALAANEGKNLATEGRAVLAAAAKSSKELAEAMSFWREGSFLFGVVSGKENPEDLSGVVIKDPPERSPDLSDKVTPFIFRRPDSGKPNPEGQA